MNISEYSDSKNVEMALLDFLRNHYNDDSINYKAIPEQIFGGYESSVYKFQLNNRVKEMDGFMILRVNHQTYDHEKFTYDTDIQIALSMTTIPVARIHVACEDVSIFGGSFVIMDCIAGEVMWEVSSERIPSMLADTHISIHSCEVDGLLNYIEDKGYLQKCLFEPVQIALENLIEAGISVANVEKWLIDNRPKSQKRSICHGDFHPNNVLVRDNQVNGILDWHFSLGDPEHDVALTVKILTINSKLHVEESEWKKLDDFTEKYLESYKEKSYLDASKLDYYMVVHCLRDLGEGVKRGGKYRTAPYRVNRQLEIVENITGFRIEL